VEVLYAVDLEMTTGVVQVKLCKEFFIFGKLGAVNITQQNLHQVITLARYLADMTILLEEVEMLRQKHFLLESKEGA
jgi:hypothetical protein